MLSKKRIFSTGTVRTGGTLLLNSLSVHSKIAMFNERFNYFRFFYDQGNSFSLKDVDRMLNQYKIRLKHRSNLDCNVGPIIESISKYQGIDNAILYDEMMQDLIRPINKDIWGEYANLEWRKIPDFLNMFPNGKVIHVCRDLRGVLASFGKMSYMPDNLYLNTIFNWIDSVNYIKKYQNSLSSKNYMMVKFEDIHANPEKTIRAVCDFLEEPFEEIMIQGDKWHDVIDEKYTFVNVSSYTKKKVWGFDKKRSETWKGELKSWELALCDHLAGDLMNEMGYSRNDKSFTDGDIRHGMDLLYAQPYLCKILENFLKTGEGIDKHPVDPANPNNWSDPDDGFKKFIDSPAYNNYIQDMEKLETYLKSKYG